jgi:fibronectin-binding autotransporter adhesin
VTMAGISDILSVASVTNAGGINMGGAGESLSTSGDFDNNMNGSLTFNGAGSNVSVGGAFNNASGAVVNMAGANDTLSTTGLFTNSGMVTVGANETINATGGYVNNGVTTVAGMLNTSGSFTGTSGSTLTMQGGTLDPTAVELKTGSTLQGYGTINGSVTINGTVTPGLPTGGGVLTINGPTTLAGGNFNELIGTGGNGLLDVNGAATLGASEDLSIKLLTGETPTDDEMFDIMNYSGTETGQFANAGSGDFTMDGWNWLINYDYDGDEVLLEALSPVTTTSTPEPSAILMLAMGLLALAAFCRRKRVNAER